MATEIIRELINGEWVTTYGTGGGGGTGLPTGWTQDAANPANVDSNGARLTVSGLFAQSDTLPGGGYVQLGDLGANVARILADTDDPSAGAGLAGYLGSLYLRTNGQAWLKTGAGDTDWTQLGGTPAAAIRVERFPIAFDDAGLAPATYAITAAAADPVNTFTVAGNHAADFVVGQRLIVTGSTLNDGTYTVASAVFGVATVVTVNEAVSDNTADGDATVLPGVVAYTPAVGDMLMVAFSTVSITTAWNGSGTPTLWLWQEGAPDPDGSIGSINSIDLTSPDSNRDQSFTDPGSITQGLRIGASGTTLPFNMLTTTPLRVGYDDAADGDPGSSQGDGEVVFVVQAA